MNITRYLDLAVVLDAYSRRVIGWALGRTLEAGLAVSALTMALRQRRPEPGLVHHSDRGVQYASHEYTDLLKQHGAQISMSRKGNPYDNAACDLQPPAMHRARPAGGERTLGEAELPGLRHELGILRQERLLLSIQIRVVSRRALPAASIVSVIVP